MAAPPPEDRPPPLDLPLPPPAAPVPPRAAPRPPQTPSQAASAAAQEAPPGPAAPPPDAPGAGSRATGAVVPPGLLEGVRNPEPEYPFASRQRGDQGVVTVLLRISEAGEVAAVEVIGTSGHPELDDSARRAVRRWRFRPARRDGVAVPGSIRTAVHFRLER
jgi:protein TonB